MKIITQNLQNDKKVNSSILKFAKTYKISAIFKSSNVYKSKGYSIIQIFLYLFSIVFSQRSMYMNYITSKHSEKFAKDTVYRFLNSLSINWLKFTTLLASRVINKALIHLTDGNTFISVSSRLLSSANSKNVIQKSKINFDKRTNAYKRRKQAITNAPDVMIELIKEALKSNIKASYVLFDTWFANPSSIIAVKKLDLDVIAMIKKTT